MADDQDRYIEQDRSETDRCTEEMVKQQHDTVDTGHGKIICTRKILDRQTYEKCRDQVDPHVFDASDYELFIDFQLKPPLFKNTQLISLFVPAHTNTKLLSDKDENRLFFIMQNGNIIYRFLLTN